MTAEPGESEGGEAVPVLTRDDINNMKVMELRSSLQARGTTTNGLKSVLVPRLEEAVEKNVPLMKKSCVRGYRTFCWWLVCSRCVLEEA